MLVFLTGMGCWVLSLLAVHQIKLIVERTETEKIHNTLIAFFIINALVSAGNLISIMLETGSINPYTFTGLHRTYFIMTGDFIEGLSFDISSTNAVLCAFGVLYFLYKKVPVMFLVCVCTLFFTFSNLINLILLFILLMIFIFKSNKVQKSLIIVCCAIYLVFMFKVSPQNGDYSIVSIKKNLLIKGKRVPTTVQLPLRERPDSTLSFEEKREKIATLYLDSVRANYKKQVLVVKGRVLDVPLTNKGRVIIKDPDSGSMANWLSPHRPFEIRRLLWFISVHPTTLPISNGKKTISKFPGKIGGLIQTFSFFGEHPSKLFTGMGIGNFSSKIAFRAAGLGIRGRYPENHTYISPDFLSNHLDLYLSYFSKNPGFRTVSNNPFSVYDQLLSEYGLLGLLALIVFYFGFFIKQSGLLTYGIPILAFVASIFFIDYWFEQLSVMLMAELMLFLNIKENKVLAETNEN